MDTTTVINLTSRIIRSQTVRQGIRVINANPHDGKGNFLGFVGNSILQVAIGLLKGIAWTFTGIWGLLVQATSFILNFNWNTSDEEINNRINAAIDTSIGLAGQAVGRTLGFLTCGALPTAALFVISPTVAKAIAGQVTKELLEQLAFQYAVIIQQLGRQFLQAASLWLYGAIRRSFRGSDEEFKKKLIASGAKPDQIQKAMDERNKPYIISQNIQNNIDNISNKRLKIFTDQAYQEFGVACIEAGYVVAGALDNYYFQQQQQQADASVEIGFNPDGSYSVKKV